MPATWPLTARRQHLHRIGQWYAEGGVGGVVLTGPAGVGKTRLGEEVLKAAAGRPTARAIGHPATQQIPLGAMAHILPADLARDLGDGTDDDRAAMFHRARVAIRERSADGRLLLLLDDVDQLDDTSLALLLPLTLEGVIFPIVTIRAGRAMPAVVASLVKDGHLSVEVVPTLRRDEVVTLLHRALDGPVDAAAIDRLSTVSDGNLQVLHEIVQRATDSGAMRFVDGMWVLDDMPLPSALEDLMRSHLGDIDAAQTDAVEVLAVAGSLGLADLEQLSSPEVVAALDARRLVEVSVDGQRTKVALAHPMYGEIVRSKLSVLRERAIQRRLADQLQGFGARRREDVVRLALWRLGGGGEVDTNILLRAGRMALAGRDIQLAVRFARAGAARGGGHDATRILVEAAVMRADFDALQEAVADCWHDPDLPDAVRAHLGRRLATAQFGRGDFDAAMDTVRQALDRVTEPTTQASMLALRASLLANAGRPLDAFATLDEVADVVDLRDGVGDPRLRTELASARSIANITLGRYGDAIEAAREGAAAQNELPDWLARRGMATHVLNEAHANLYSGHIDEARALVETALPSAESAGALAAQVWLRVTLGEIERDRGCGSAAVEHFTVGATLAARAGQHAASVWAVVGIAQGHLLLGDLTAAQAALADADALGHSPVATSWSTRERTRALLLAGRGDLDGARTLLRHVAHIVHADALYGFESTLHYDLVRFGDPDGGFAGLSSLVPHMQSRILLAMVAHAEAARDQSADGLRDASILLEQAGAIVFAAECAVAAADRYEHSGQPRPAMAMRRRATQLVASVGGAATPALRSLTGDNSLSSREREVATLAAAGLGNREIAAQLFLSKRTVDAHLDRIYRKLGIGGRDELPAALS